jgi:hypothetical protein
MGDVSSEPTMEEILSSIKRVIEESDAAPAARARRPAARTVAPAPSIHQEDEEVLELSERAPFFAAAEPTPPPPQQRDEAPMLSPESIVSPTTAQASREPLEALSRLIVRPEVAGGDTLEGLVREMLRPMLREWLDAQLPSIVESMVAKEIARISNRGL